MGYRNRKITAIAAAIAIGGLAGSALVPAYAGKLVDGYYAEVQALGGNRWDTSSLIARLERG